MSYEKHTWETGETITAEKLNNLEDGIASSGSDSEDVLKVNFTIDATKENSLISDKTSKEICDAIYDGKTVSGCFHEGTYSKYILNCSQASGSNAYNITFSCPVYNAVIIVYKNAASSDNTSWSFTQKSYQ